MSENLDAYIACGGVPADAPTEEEKEEEKEEEVPVVPAISDADAQKFLDGLNRNMRYVENPLSSGNMKAAEYSMKDVVAWLKKEKPGMAEHPMLAERLQLAHSLVDNFAEAAKVLVLKGESISFAKKLTTAFESVVTKLNNATMAKHYARDVERVLGLIKEEITTMGPMAEIYPKARDLIDNLEVYIERGAFIPQAEVPVKEEPKESAKEEEETATPAISDSDAKKFLEGLNRVLRFIEGPLSNGNKKAAEYNMKDLIAWLKKEKEGMSEHPMLTERLELSHALVDNFDETAKELMLKGEAESVAKKLTTAYDSVYSKLHNDTVAKHYARDLERVLGTVKDELICVGPMVDIYHKAKDLIDNLDKYLAKGILISKAAAVAKSINSQIKEIESNRERFFNRAELAAKKLRSILEGDVSSEHLRVSTELEEANTKGKEILASFDEYAEANKVALLVGQIEKLQVSIQDRLDTCKNLSTLGSEMVKLQRLVDEADDDIKAKVTAAVELATNGDALIADAKTREVEVKFKTSWESTCKRLGIMPESGTIDESKTKKTASQLKTMLNTVSRFVKNDIKGPILECASAQPIIQIVHATEEFLTVLAEDRRKEETIIKTSKQLETSIETLKKWVLAKNVTSAGTARSTVVKHLTAIEEADPSHDLVGQAHAALEQCDIELGPLIIEQTVKKHSGLIEKAKVALDTLLDGDDGYATKSISSFERLIKQLDTALDKIRGIGEGDAIDEVLIPASGSLEAGQARLAELQHAQLVEKASAALTRDIKNLVNESKNFRGQSHQVASLVRYKAAIQVHLNGENAHLFPEELLAEVEAAKAGSDKALLEYDKKEAEQAAGRYIRSWLREIEEAKRMSQATKALLIDSCLCVAYPFYVCMGEDSPEIVLDIIKRDAILPPTESEIATATPILEAANSSLEKDDLDTAFAVSTPLRSLFRVEGVMTFLIALDRALIKRYDEISASRDPKEKNYDGFHVPFIYLPSTFIFTMLPPSLDRISFSGLSGALSSAAQHANRYIKDLLEVIDCCERGISNAYGLQKSTESYIDDAKCMRFVTGVKSACERTGGDDCCTYLINGLTESTEMTLRVMKSFNAILPYIVDIFTRTAELPPCFAWLEAFFPIARKATAKWSKNQAVAYDITRMVDDIQFPHQLMPSPRDYGTGSGLYMFGIYSTTVMMRSCRLLDTSVQYIQSCEDLSIDLLPLPLRAIFQFQESQLPAVIALRQRYVDAMMEDAKEYTFPWIAKGRSDRAQDWGKLILNGIKSFLITIDAEKKRVHNELFKKESEIAGKELMKAEIKKGQTLLGEFKKQLEEVQALARAAKKAAAEEEKKRQREQKEREEAAIKAVRDDHILPYDEPCQIVLDGRRWEWTLGKNREDQPIGQLTCTTKKTGDNIPDFIFCPMRWGKGCGFYPSGVNTPSVEFEADHCDISLGHSKFCRENKTDAGLKGLDYKLEGGIPNVSGGKGVPLFALYLVGNWDYIATKVAKVQIEWEEEQKRELEKCAILCDSCAFGSGKDNCLLCGKWVGSSSYRATRCSSCRFGSKKTKCDKCGREAFDRWVPAKLCSDCGFSKYKDKCVHCKSYVY
eukprot:gnl/Carplike_NY0171/1728_a2333_553.p1 GENE.gnl/Carplike_NY0171/1728_a2333_553~~gnl/Carplike_NY0171/1728_a2333_553.p1  ORF type:complete len:1731 (-),score=653.83 gnl/Carplike_NY0171/1728_a2333_553:139-4908(-)